MPAWDRDRMSSLALYLRRRGPVNLAIKMQNNVQKYDISIEMSVPSKLSLDMIPISTMFVHFCRCERVLYYKQRWVLLCRKRSLWYTERYLRVIESVLDVTRDGSKKVATSTRPVCCSTIAQVIHNSSSRNHPAVSTRLFDILNAIYVEQNLLSTLRKLNPKESSLSTRSLRLPKVA